MATTTATLSGTITDVIGEVNPRYTGRIVMVVESNTTGSILRDTVGNILMAGARRVEVDGASGAYAVELVTTTSGDILPADDRLYQVTLIYPSGVPGQGNVTARSGWFEFTADASLADPGIWQGIEVTAVSSAVYASISEYVTLAEGIRDETQAIRDGIIGDLGTTDSQTATLVNGPSLTSNALSATFAGLDATVNNFTGKVEMKDGAFTNPLDSKFYIASIRGNPTVDTEGMYIQHRVVGTGGASVHDGGASELRVTGITNVFGLNAWETTMEVGGTGNVIPDARSITSNFVLDPGVSGTLTRAVGIFSQTIPTSTLTITKAIAIYAEEQNVGTVENWSVYAPNGWSHLFAATVGDPLTLGGVQQFPSAGVGSNGVQLHVFKKGATDTATQRIEASRSRLELQGTGGSNTNVISFRTTAAGEKFRIQHNSSSDQLEFGPVGAVTFTVKATGETAFFDGGTLSMGATTGQKIGKTGEKIAFLGAIPIVRPAAPTAADAATVDATYGTEEAGVINNTRTRLGEIETKLRALGLIA